MAATTGMEISAIEKGREQRSWKLSLGDGIVATGADRGAFVLTRDEVMKKTVILDGLFFRRTISFKKPIGKALQLDEQAFQAFADWLGYKPMLALSLKQRYAWILGVGFLFIISSIPLPGDPHKGIAPSPWKPLDLGMGASLLLIGYFSKKLPHRCYFLLDSAWFLLLSVSTFASVIASGSQFWLLIVALQLSLAVSGFLLWRRFTAFAKRQATAGPAA
jgi:hypothetical protein